MVIAIQPVRLSRKLDQVYSSSYNRINTAVARVDKAAAGFGDPEQEEAKLKQPSPYTSHSHSSPTLGYQGPCFSPSQSLLPTLRGRVSNSNDII